MSWPIVALGEVAEIERNSVKPENIVSGTRYLGLEHIESGGRIISSETVKNGELASSKFNFGSRHILYGKLRPYLAKIALPNFDGVCSTDILPVLPSGRIEKNYLAHYLRQSHMVDYANSLATGANLPRLNPKALAEFPIPLPPLEEQKRIAGILDQADALRRLRTRALDKLNTLGQAIFHEMFGDVHSNKKGFKRVQLGEVIKVSSGQGLTAKDMKSGEFPVYGGNGINGYHDEGPVPANTIVIGRVGAYCGAVHTTKSQCWVTDNALVVRNILPVNTAYLAAALELAELNQYAGRAAQPLVSGSRIYPVEILFPPIEAQDEFERVQAKSQHHKNLISESSGSIDNLFAALQHRAFRGDL